MSLKRIIKRHIKGFLMTLFASEMAEIAIQIQEMQTGIKANARSINELLDDEQLAKLSGVQDLKDSIDSLENKVDNIDYRLEEVERLAEGTSDTCTDNENDIDDHEDRISNNEDDIAGLKEKVYELEQYWFQLKRQEKEKEDAEI